MEYRRVTTIMRLVLYVCRQLDYLIQNIYTGTHAFMGYTNMSMHEVKVTAFFLASYPLAVRKVGNKPTFFLKEAL